MKITIYSTFECQFSKQEKEYLKSHKLPFDEKNLESNKEFLTEMLAVSNNFAGTPVTKLEKDNGQISILKGFTKEEFDKELGFQTQTSPTAAALPPQTKISQPPKNQVPPPAQAPSPVAAASPQIQPAVQNIPNFAPSAVSQSPAPVPAQVPPQTTTQTPVAVETVQTANPNAVSTATQTADPAVAPQETVQTSPQDDHLKSILNDLQTMAGTQTPQSQTPNQVNETAPAAPASDQNVQ